MTTTALGLKLRLVGVLLVEPQLKGNPATTENGKGNDDQNALKQTRYGCYIYHAVSTRLA